MHEVIKWKIVFHHNIAVEKLISLFNSVGYEENYVENNWIFQNDRLQIYLTINHVRNGRGEEYVAGVYVVAVYRYYNNCFAHKSYKWKM